MRNGLSRAAVIAASVAMVVGSVVIVTRYLADEGWMVLAAGIVAVSAVSVLFAVPVHWLPALAVAAFAIVPNRLMPNESVFNAIPPVSVILLIWVFRRVVLQQRTHTEPQARASTRGDWTRPAVILTAVLFVAWSVMTALRSEHLDTGVSWLTSLSIGMLSPLFVGEARAEARLLRWAWLRVGFLCGLYAAVEVVLQGSPVFGTLYDALGYGSTQHWAVYRAEVTFGHPIFAAAYMVPAAVLGIGGWLQSGRRSELLFGGVSAVGVVATVSRGEILAVAIGVVVALLLVTLLPRRPWRRIGAIAVLGAIAAVGVLNFPPLTARLNSLDAERSSEARDIGTEVALQAAANAGWIGSGPGTSGISGREIYDVVIENSLLQLLISIGIPGLALFLVLVGLLAVSALRRRDVAVAAAVIAYLAAISTFNAIDAVRALHLLLGLLVILALNAEEPARVERPSRRGGAAGLRMPAGPGFEIAPERSRLLS